MLSSNAKWKIAVISTFQDLHYLRDILGENLKKKGFEVLMFERPGYPVYPKVSAHEACLLALKESDIVILIMDNKYGGLYLEKGPASITESEYFEAYKSGKIIIPCINQNSEQERKTLSFAIEHLVKEQKLSIKEARDNIKTSYVDDWKVLDFIQKVRSADTDNFAIFFQETEDLIQKIMGRLSGLTCYICHKIVENQIKIVKSMRTAAGLTISLGDVLDRGYFIEPHYNIISGKDPKTDNISNLFDLVNQDSKIMIIGVAGTGKSTLLGKAFLDHATSSFTQKSVRIPFYLSLRGLGTNYHFDFDKFLEECCNRDLGKEDYPLFDKGNISPVFYIDGFDEIAEQFSEIDLKNVMDSVFFSSPLVLCSRTRFAEERLEVPRFASRFELIVELLLWEKDRSWQYIQKFCKIHRNLNLYNKMREAYYKSDEITQILENPLLLTMFLWIVHESQMELPLDVKDQTSVYDRFIDLWISRELSRAGMNGSKGTHEAIKRGWQLTAWEIYRRRFLGETIYQYQLNEYLLSHYKNLDNILKYPAYYQFLDIRPHTEEIRGMFHEQFMEHLIAKEIVRCTIEADYPFPDFLEYEIRPEINRTIRTLWLHRSKDDIDVILRKLWEVYKDRLKATDAQSIAVRNHTTYYIGRLPHPKAQNMLIEADKIEEEPFVKLSIAFGLMKLKDFNKERELFAKLNSKIEWDKANRGYHLVYYGDWIVKGENPPYLDDGTKEWGNTLRALLRHIKSKESRHIPLRRIELFTINQFIKVRKSRGPITQDHLDIIKEAVKDMPDDPKGFKGEVEKTCQQLEKIFSRFA
jgi:hypothetical protein